jgi:methylaspartate mutase sigma subunit
MKDNNPANLVMGVIGSDSHAIGNRILAYALNEAGYTIVNLGSFVSQEEFINAAIESSAKVILVSSLCGHAEIDCQGFKNKLIEAGLQDTLLYIGGTLAPPYTRPVEVVTWLQEDLDKNKHVEAG